MSNAKSRPAPIRKTAQRPPRRARADLIDLFNAGLADQQDLRSQRAPVRPGNAARSSRSTRKVHDRDRAATKAPGRRQGRPGERSLLLVLGESPADKRAIAYVGRLLGRHRGFRVCITYVLPEFPPSLLEHGGAGDPQAEDRLSTGLAAERKIWIAEEKEGARRLIDRATQLLRSSGLRSGALETRFCGPAGEAAVPDEILTLARKRRCRTVVVASHQRSWLASLSNGDLAPNGRAKRVAIWAIG